MATRFAILPVTALITLTAQAQQAPTPNDQAAAARANAEQNQQAQQRRDAQQRDATVQAPGVRSDVPRPEAYPVLPTETPCFQIDGAVTLAEYVHKGRGRDLHVSCGRRILGDLGKFTPRREAYGEVFAIKRSTQQMPLQGEVLADRPEAREESLSALRVAKSPHASLAFAGRLMAVLGAVVHAGGGLHEHVLDVGELRDASLGSRVAA